MFGLEHLFCPAHGMPFWLALAGFLPFGGFWIRKQILKLKHKAAQASKEAEHAEEE